VLKLTVNYRNVTGNKTKITERDETYRNITGTLPVIKLTPNTVLKEDSCKLPIACCTRTKHFQQILM
jgi:hypothetical protein